MNTVVQKPLTEYVPAEFAREEIPDLVGETLWRNYREKVQVEFPSPVTDGKWRLTVQGWVGYIPVTPEFGFRIDPKVELENLFGMLEYAYQLKSFEILEGLVDCHSMEEFYERLANILARRVLDRGRKGFYRSYLSRSESLPFMRGRLDVQRAIRKPWAVDLHCHYEDHTPDVEENRILAWTLWRIARSGMCTERVLPTVRRAYRALQRFVVLEPIRPEQCVGLLYHRLNEDYQPLHALCRFFLEHTGPGHQVGDHTMIPFLVNMARLFELFVAQWLQAHAPAGLTPQAQEKVSVGESGTLDFNIDIVLYDVALDVPRCVLDTKYKIPKSPSQEDVSQIVTYAELKGCREAVLVYPVPLAEPLDANIGKIHVRSVTFSLDGDLEQAGQAFLGELLSATHVPAEPTS